MNMRLGRCLALAAVGVVSAVCVTAAAASTARASDYTKAENAALDWLKLVDTGKYSKSWNAASILFRLGVTDAKWTEQAKSVREQTGAFDSRKVLHTEFTTTLPGAPRGRYIVVQFDSSFANWPHSVETVVMSNDNGHWKTSGYFVRQQ